MKQKNTKLGQNIINQNNLRMQSPYTLPIKKARKNRLYDYDGNVYIDFYLQKGTVLLGYKYQTLSTQIQNRLSIGFLGGFYTHLAYRAQQSILEYFKSIHITLSHSILFFMSEQERLNFMTQHQIKSQDLVYHQYKQISLKESFCLDFSLANGSPIYILLLAPNINDTDYLLCVNISPLYYQSIITTIQTLLKKELEIQKILSSFQKEVKEYQNHYFILDIELEKWKSVAPQLLAYGFIVDQTKPIFYICLQTTSQDIKQLLKTISYLLE